MGAGDMGMVIFTRAAYINNRMLRSQCQKLFYMYALSQVGSFTVRKLMFTE